MKTNTILFFLALILSGFAGLSQDTTRLSLMFVGDIMQHDSQIAAAYDEQTNTYNYKKCFQYVGSLIQKADLAIGNLEFTLGGKPYKGYPQFSGPDELVYAIRDAGFDVVVTANNHCVDRGRKGLERTIKMLDSAGIVHTGTFTDSASRAESYPLMVEKKGIKIALLNYTYGTNGLPVKAPNIVNFIDTATIRLDISEAKQKNPDIVVVFFHWGDEYRSLPNTTQKKIAELCLASGVQMVIGSHPHVLQPIEWHNEKNQLVVYSLGNFVSGQRVRYRDGGMMVNVELTKVTLDSVSTTTISDVNYDLVWINVTKKNGFEILPVNEFELDTAALNDKSRQLFSTFVSDSRALLSKHNVNVPEVRRPMIDSVFYRIFVTSTPDSVSLSGDALLSFYGIDSLQAGDSIQWMAGKFQDEEVARIALEEITTKSNYKDARLIRYWWGRREE